MLDVEMEQADAIAVISIDGTEIEALLILGCTINMFGFCPQHGCVEKVAQYFLPSTLVERLLENMPKGVFCIIHGHN